MAQKGNLVHIWKFFLLTFHTDQSVGDKAMAKRSNLVQSANSFYRHFTPTSLPLRSVGSKGMTKKSYLVQSANSFY